MQSLRSSSLVARCIRSALSPRSRIVRRQSTGLPHSDRGDGTTDSGQARRQDVTLDGETLYVSEDVAERLDWKPDEGLEGVSLTLHGWAPAYFAITRSGTDADRLARGTIESSRNPRVKEVLDYLKER